MDGEAGKRKRKVTLSFTSVHSVYAHSQSSLQNIYSDFPKSEVASSIVLELVYPNPDRDIKHRSITAAV